MKRRPEKNYRIKISNVSLEENPDSIEFFRNIYLITINECLDFIFLPKGFYPSQKFISIPPNPDKVNSIDEVIGSLSLGYQYFICSGSGSENKIETFYSIEEENRKKANYFFITSENTFLKIQGEMNELVLKTPFVTDFISRDEIKEYKIINYLETRIFCSLVLKEKEYESIEKFGESVIRKFIDTTVFLSEKNLNIYHGYLDQLEDIEFIEKGILKNEYYLIGARHRFLKDKKTILYSNPTHRCFWAFFKSSFIENLNMNQYFVSGISIYQKNKDPDIYIERFRKIFRMDSENDFSIYSNENLFFDANPVQKVEKYSHKNINDKIIDSWIFFILGKNESLKD